MNAPRDSGYESSLLQSLKDPEEAAAYLEAVMELEDPATLLVALRQVAKAHGMAEVAPAMLVDAVQTPLPDNVAHAQRAVRAK